MPAPLPRRDPERLWQAGDARLAPEQDPERARAILEGYAAPDAAQARLRRALLAFLAEAPHPLERQNLAAHLTASALVLDRAGERVLLGHHRKLGRWLQLGGHADGDANLVGVALRECLEESGIEGLAIDPAPIDLDIHPIPARPGEPAHQHLDVRFVVVAPEGARPVVSPESLELAWLAPAQARALGLDESLERLLARVLGAPAGGSVQP